jgi:energy-converting hydrogenase Eha subunit G
MCVVVLVFRVRVLAGFSSGFAVLVGGLLLYWASRGVEATAITTMEGYDLPRLGKANKRGGSANILI